MDSAGLHSVLELNFAARRHGRLMTLHPCGLPRVGDEFPRNPRFDVIGYQALHGKGDDRVRWLADGPPTREWDGGASVSAPVLDGAVVPGHLMAQQQRGSPGS